MNIGIYDQRSGIAESGGTETYIRGFVRELSDSHDITLYTQRGNLLKEIEAMDIEVVQIGSLTKSSSVTKFLTSATPVKSAEIGALTMYMTARVKGVFDRMEREEDVVSTHYYLDNILVSRTLDIPTVFRFPGIKQQSPRWDAMVKFADPEIYLVNSRSTEKRVNEWYDIDIVEVVYPGVRQKRFTNAITNYVSEDTTVLFVGRIDEGKGLFDLVKAIARLDKPDVTLRIVGDGNLESELRNEIERLGISDVVEMPGAIPHDKIHYEYARADVFCLPSHHESHGIVNIEAMLSGIPVLSTRIDAIKEYITDDETGVLVEPGDVGALTRALERYIDSSEYRAEIADAGRTAAREYTVEACAEEMEKVYKEAVERDRNGTDTET